MKNAKRILSIKRPVINLNLLMLSTVLFLTVLSGCAAERSSYVPTNSPSTTTPVTQETVATNTIKTDSVSDTIDIIPVSAEVIEYPKDGDFSIIDSLEGMGYWSKEGWKTIYLSVVVGNKTSSFVGTLPEKLHGFNTPSTPNNLTYTLVTPDGYSYQGGMAHNQIGNAIGPLPPLIYVKNIFGRIPLSDEYTFNNIRIMFQVPMSMTKFSFVYDDQNPIDISNLLAGENKQNEIMTQKLSSYSDIYNKSLSDAIFTFKEKALVTVKSVNMANTKVNVFLEVKNGGGSDIEIAGQRDFIFTIIDSDGNAIVIFDTGISGFDTIAPGITKNYELSQDLPEGYNAKPLYISVYNVSVPKESIVIKLNG